MEVHRTSMPLMSKGQGCLVALAKGNLSFCQRSLNISETSSLVEVNFYVESLQDGGTKVNIYPAAKETRKLVTFEFIANKLNSRNICHK